jgi:hypothetical protein
MNKKTITATVALLSLLISQITFAQKKQFLLTGQLTNCTDSLIYLGYGTLNTSFKDSAVVKTRPVHLHRHCQ